MKEFDSYKINEILEHKYYQIPQELFDNPLYKDNLTSDSKILYAFLLDRLTLSKKNNWIDKNGSIYLIFTRQEVQEKLNLSDKTVTKAFKQLVDVNLIYEKSQGFGKAKLIFVGKIQHEEINTDTEILRVDNRKNYDTTTVENTIINTENLRRINTNTTNTNIINTDSINPKSEDVSITLNKLKQQCKLDDFIKEEKTVLEDIIDTLYYSPTLKVGAVTINNLKILSKLELITKDNLLQLLDIKRNTPNIKNMTNYLVICLYNNLGNPNISTTFCKSTNSNKYSEREYPIDFFENFYANIPYRKDSVMAT